jgi:hypothetical protein
MQSTPCHPDRSRATLSRAKGSEGEWKDPGAVSCAIVQQSALIIGLRHLYAV